MVQTSWNYQKLFSDHHRSQEREQSTSQQETSWPQCQTVPSAHHTSPSGQKVAAGGGRGGGGGGGSGGQMARTGTLSGTSPARALPSSPPSLRPAHGSEGGLVTPALLLNGYHCVCDSARSRKSDVNYTHTCAYLLYRTYYIHMSVHTLLGGEKD